MAKEKIIARKGKYLTIDIPYRNKGTKSVFNFHDGMTNNGIQGAHTSEVEQLMQNIQEIAATAQNTGNVLSQFSNSDVLSKLLSKARGKVLGGFNTARNIFDAYKYNAQGADLTTERNALATMNNMVSDAGTFDSLASDADNLQTWDNLSYQDTRGTTGWQRAGHTLKNMGSTFATAKGGLISKLAQTAAVGMSGLIGNFAGNSNARYNQAKMNAAGDIAEQRQANTIIAQSDKINDAAYDKQMLQYVAFGGNLFDKGGYMDNEFTNGVKEINAGGSHEENPYEGVPMGEGNLVEEGEVIKDGYVYSNRLHPTVDQLKSVGLPTKYKRYTYAKIAEELSKESKETPNDSISRRSLDANFEKLKTIAEQTRKSVESATEMMQQNTPNVFGNSGQLEEPENEGIDTKEEFIDASITDIDPVKKRALNTVLDKAAVLDIPQNNSLAYSKPQKPVEASENENTAYPTWMRYAPIFGAGSMALSDALGISNTPDYSAAEVAERASLAQRGVRFDPIGDYVKRNPLDRNYYLTQLANQNLAAQRAANNAANRYQANAMNLASMYNAGEGIGKTLMQMDQYNAQDALKAAEFNRITNQYNSEGALKEQMANAEANNRKMTGLLQAAQLRAAEKQRTDNARSLNLTNFFDNIGELGRENMAFNMVNSNRSQYYGIDKGGNVYYKQAFYDADPEVQKQIVSITGVTPVEIATNVERGPYTKEQLDLMKRGAKEIIKEKRKSKNSDKETSALGGYLTVKNKK